MKANRSSRGDGGVLSNLPAFVFQNAESSGSAPFATRILAFSLSASQGVNTPADSWETATALFDTVVDGGSKVQRRILSDVHVIEIPTSTVRATDFEKMEKPPVAGGLPFDDDLSF